MGLGYSLLLLLLFVEASCEYCFFVVMGFLVSGKEGIFFFGFYGCLDLVLFFISLVALKMVVNG